jgi:hypothetical protein
LDGVLKAAGCNTENSRSGGKFRLRGIVVRERDGRARDLRRVATEYQREE